MRKRQWRALGGMFFAFCFLTMITGSVVSVQDDPYSFLRMYGYLARFMGYCSNYMFYLWMVRKGIKTLGGRLA